VTYPSRNANAGPIAGGVVGGVVFLGLIIALIIWLVQRRRDRTIPRAPDLDGDGTSPRPMSDVSAIGAISPYMAMQTPKFYVRKHIMVPFPTHNLFMIGPFGP